MIRLIILVVLFLLGSHGVMANNDTIPTSHDLFNKIRECDCNGTISLLEQNVLDEKAKKYGEYYKSLVWYSWSNCQLNIALSHNDTLHKSWDTLRYGLDVLLLDSLINRGIDVNILNKEGETSLFLFNHYPRGIFLLVERGAIPSTKNKYGETMLDVLISWLFAIGMWTENTMNYLKSISYLLEKGGTLTEIDVEGIESMEERRQIMHNYLIELCRDKENPFVELESYLLENGLPKVNPVLVGFPKNWRKIKH